MDLGDYVAAKGQAMVGFAYVLTGDLQLAEDIVQDALVKAHRRWVQILVAWDRDAYVRRMIVNSHLDGRRRRSSTEVPVEFRADALASPDPDHAAQQAERTQMWRALAELPPRQRAVLVLRHYADCDDRAIAELLGCGVSTVRSQASRGLATLRTAWIDYERRNELEARR